MSRKSRKRRDKKHDLMAHARKRAWLRYALELTQEVHDVLVDMVQTNKTKLIEKQSIRVTVHEATYKKNTIRFAYDRQRKQIITFLHADPAKYLEEAHMMYGEPT